MEDGTAMRILEWKRHEVAARQAMAKRLLNGHRVQTHPSSPHAWLHLPARWTAEAFAARCAREMYSSTARRRFQLRINRRRARFDCVSERRAPAPASKQALTRVVTALAERTPAARAVV